MVGSLIKTDKKAIVKGVGFVVLAVGVGFVLSGKVGGRNYISGSPARAQSASTIESTWTATKLLALDAFTKRPRTLLGLGPAEWKVETSKDGVKIYEEIWTMDKSPFGLPPDDNNPWPSTIPPLSVNYNDTGKNGYISGFTGAYSEGEGKKMCRDLIASRAQYKIVAVDDSNFSLQNISAGNSVWGGAHFGRGTVGLACPGTSKETDNHLTVTGPYSWALFRYADGDGQGDIPITGMMIPLKWNVKGTLTN